jgi:hypothetical protein
MDGDEAPAGHIEGTCGRDAPGKDEKGREPDSKVRARSDAERLVSTTRRTVLQLQVIALVRSSPRQGADIGADQVKQPRLMTT